MNLADHEAKILDWFDKIDKMLSEINAMLKNTRDELSAEIKIAELEEK